MSTPPPSSSPQGGAAGGQHGVIGQALDLSKSLLSTLPPAFLLLVLINVAFVGMLMWFLSANQDRRADMIDKLIDRCMEIALHATPSPLR